MSLFGDDPAGDAQAPARAPRPTNAMFEYDVVWMDPHTSPTSRKWPAAVMNEYAAHGWRVVSVVQNIDNASRGRHLIVTFERQTR